MTNIVNFILESGISLAVLALVYVFFLRKETYFRLNRFFLLSSVFFSIVLPFLKFQVYNPDPVLLSEITVTPYRNLIEAVTVYGKDLSGSIEKAILSANLVILIYVGGMVLFLIRFIHRITKIIFIINNNYVCNQQGFKLVVVDKLISPFSFLRYIFVNQSVKEKEIYNKLIVHELEHVRQGHSVDVLILELLLVFQWFNPFMWMLRSAITENHEYLADQAVLKSGIKKGYYKILLLNQCIGEQFRIANNFNYSLIKKRFKMMSRIKSSKIAFGKILFGILAAAGLIIVFACEGQNSYIISSNGEIAVANENVKIKGAVDNMNKLTQLIINNISYEVAYDSLGNITLTKKKEEKTDDSLQNEKIYNTVEEMPQFPGGEDALRKYITNTVEYPEIALQKGIQGKVLVSFIVTKKGNVANAKIVGSVEPSLDKESLRVINSLPQWKPGKHRGETVNVNYTLPINFELGPQKIKQNLVPMQSQ